MSSGAADDPLPAPASSGAAAAAVPPVLCLRCSGPLGPVEDGDDEARCTEGHRTPVVAGILDCRAPLTGFEVDADRRLAEELAAMTAATFEQRLRHYWQHQPDVSSDRRERFVRGDLIAEDRSREVVGQIAAQTGALLSGSTVVLEVGCGTAALGAALATAGAGHVVVTDVSLAWLVLARVRCQQGRRRHVQLVAATADRLPFADRAFDLVVAADVVEHVPDVVPAVDECFRVLARGGHLWLSTPNRFSLTPEPHVRLLGVGFLPRRIAVPLVRRLRGTDYAQIRTLSAVALSRALARTGGSTVVQAPPIPDTLRATYGGLGRRLIDAYHLARKAPVARPALLAVAPLFHATVRRTD